MIVEGSLSIIKTKVQRSITTNKKPRRKTLQNASSIKSKPHNDLVLVDILKPLKGSLPIIKTKSAENDIQRL